MKASGQNPSDEELAQIIREVDIDGDGTINFDEFIAMMTGGRSRAPPPEPPVAAQVDSSEKEVVLEKEVVPAPSIAVPAATAESEDAEKDLKKAWSEFDHSLKGSITASQFRQVMAELGETVTDAEIDGIINSVDDEDKISCRFLHQCEMVAFVLTSCR